MKDSVAKKTKYEPKMKKSHQMNTKLHKIVKYKTKIKYKTKKKHPLFNLLISSPYRS
jgi:hypothetical protein